MKTINVEQDHFVSIAVSDAETSLTSSGIGPCICIMAKGKIGDVDYIAMLHWSGFSFPHDHVHTEQKFEQEITQLFSLFSLKIASQLDEYEEDPEVQPLLEHLYLVGGQKEENDPDTGELLVSGTELEVNALLKYTEMACNHSFQTSDTLYDHQYYTTSGTDDLSVFFSLAELVVKKNGGDVSSAEDSEEEEASDENESVSQTSKRPRFS